MSESAQLKEDVDGAPTPPGGPKKRGRPPGSKNKAAPPKVPKMDNAAWDKSQTQAEVPPSDAELQLATGGVLAFEIAMTALAGPRGAAAVHDKRGELGTCFVRLQRAFPVEVDPRWAAVGSLVLCAGSIFAASGALDPVTAAVAEGMNKLANAARHMADDAAELAKQPPTVEVRAQ